jgi:glycosyltransferase involved in cell wall biosynthesis
VAVQNGDSEGLPNVVLEAMASAAPVIASDVGGIGDAVEHGRTGFLLSAGDSRAIAAAVERLLGDTALRCRMGVAARAAATAHFDALTQSRMLEDALLAVSLDQAA